MWRKVENVLQDWKKRRSGKALLVTGARQIGKTYIIRKFGKENYGNFVELNFLTRPIAGEIFSGDLNAETLVRNLTAFLNRHLEVGKTLIFFDEIQECPAARTAIKFLVDDGRFDYIESGSLLGVQYKYVPSYPVGYEQIVHMCPMNFEEFCVALGVQKSTFDYLRDCYANLNEIASSVHKTMLDLFKYYTVVGGMPEAVQSFINSNDLGLVTKIQKDILFQYRQDISKYSSDKRAKIKDIFDRIPAQLSDKNRRFQLASISKNARLREYEESFVWLRDAGVALPCYNLTEPKVPLKINEQSRLFKLFLNDCGLLCAMSMENVQFDILKGNLSINMGSVLENVFAQQLESNGFKLRYIDKRNIGELDFVIQRGNQVIPIEIKSGKNYKAHAALDHALETWNLECGMIFCSENIEKDKKLTYLPWYMIMFLQQVELMDEKIKLDLSGLRI